MAKFVYKLQNLLDIRMRMEEQAKGVFGEAMAVLNDEEQKLVALHERLSGYEDEAHRLRQDKLSIMELRENTRAVDHLRELIKEQEIAVQKAKDNVELARHRLQTAMQDRKIQEKLKENSLEEFKKELVATENKETDELVSYTYGERIKKANFNSRNAEGI